MFNRVGFFLFSEGPQPRRPVADSMHVNGIERKVPMRLAIKIKQQSNGTYWACCPSLPGCYVYGQTKEDTRSRIDLAVQGYLASLDVCLPRELNKALAMEVA